MRLEATRQPLESAVASSKLQGVSSVRERRRSLIETRPKLGHHRTIPLWGDPAAPPLRG